MGALSGGVAKLFLKHIELKTPKITKKADQEVPTESTKNPDAASQQDGAEAKDKEQASSTADFEELDELVTQALEIKKLEFEV